MKIKHSWIIGFAPFIILNAQFGFVNGLSEVPQKPPIRAEFEEIGAFPYVPTSTEKDVFSLIGYFAEKYGVDADLAFKIVECESNWNEYARNGSSTAKSYFQFLNGTWKETMRRMGNPRNTDVFNTYEHIKAGIWLLSKDGTRHWNESKECWKR